MSYSYDICNRIVRFLESDDWKYEVDTEDEVIRLARLTLHNKMQHVKMMFDLRDDKYLLYFTCPLNVAEAERPEMARLLNLINYNLMFGSFEMDEDDGEVKMRYAVDCDNCPPSQEVIRHSLYRCASTFEKYGDAIMMVMMGFASAPDAFARAQEKD